MPAAARMRAAGLHRQAPGHGAGTGQCHGARRQVDPGRWPSVSRRPCPSLLGDRAVYIDASGGQGRAVARRHDPRRRPRDRLRALASIDPELAKALLDLNAVYTNDFVKKANAKGRLSGDDRRAGHRAGHAGVPPGHGAGVRVGVVRRRNTYRLNDALGSLGLRDEPGGRRLRQSLFKVAMYTLVFQHLALFEPSPSSPWWLRCSATTSATTGCTAPATAWRAVGRARVHHQSEDYNLSLALRQTSSGFARLDLLPAAGRGGVPPLVFGVVALVDLLCQFWVHTQQVGKLGWFDRWFCSPSNHRAHHAVNDRYLIANYGGILIIWGPAFGSLSKRTTATRWSTARARRCAASTRCGPTCRFTATCGWTVGARAPGPTSCASGSSRRAGGRPTWRRWPKPAFDLGGAALRPATAGARGPGWLAHCRRHAGVGLGLFLGIVHRPSLAEQLLQRFSRWWRRCGASAT